MTMFALALSSCTRAAARPGAILRLRQCPASHQPPLQVAALLGGSRHFGGRSSRKPGGAPPSGAGDGGGASKPPAGDAGVPASGGGSASEPASGTGAAGAAGVAGADAGGTGEASSPSSKNSPTNARALFALPLYRKPAFSGFYQIVQVSEQEVLDFLFALRKNGQGEYLGGFMTKELPSKIAETDIESGSGSGGSAASAAASQSLRRDAGRVSSAAELEEVGTILQVINLTQYPNISGGQVVVMPHKRIRRTRVVSAPSPNVALAAVAVDYLSEPEVPQDDDQVKALHLEIVAAMKESLSTSFLYKEQFEQVIRFYDLDDPLKLMDLVAGMSLAQRQDLQAVLVEDDLHARLNKVLAIVKKDLEFARLQAHVKGQVEEKVTKEEQRRQMLTEQMRQITRELGIEKDDKQSLIETFRDALKDKTVPEEPSKVIESELTKLGTLEPSSSEFNICRTYLEWLTCLPWGNSTVENKDIKKAEGILDDDHHGLEDVKERILEHIAVSFLKGSVQGKIMCMIGPPGVGKTSIGKSIARALDRKFFRFSVGGLHDVAEIRGHRRTYVGAMPGKLIQCLKLTGSSNPVVLIDEIDKLGRDFRGDPSSALLEVLDPEQNNSFRDHYLDVPVDLSQVLFVCTANVADTIPGPLLDRMEVIRIAGYVHEEKVAIANKYLIPKIAENTGIGSDSIELKIQALDKIISEYARESGVRQLQKLLEKVSRKVALAKVRKTKEEKEHEKEIIDTDSLTKYIGQPLHLSDRLFAAGTPPGVVMGLAWTSMGGVSLYIEARGQRKHQDLVLPEVNGEDAGKDGKGEEGEAEGGPKGGGGGDMKVTGQLGSVMGESSDISLTYSRLFLRELAPENDFLDEARIHLNVPEGGVPKDGPSAGVTMTTSLVSLGLNASVKTDLAMTGELTLTGKVLKIGGVKEKVIAARRERVQTLLLPRQNQADYVELKDYLKAGLTVHFCDHYDDVYNMAFEEGSVPKLSHPPRGFPMVTVHTPAAEASAESDAAPPVVPETKPTDAPASVA